MENIKFRRYWGWLFGRQADQQMSLGRIILWWELRRIPYNLIIGATGLISLLLFFVFICSAGVLRPGEDAVEPLAVIAVPFIINFFYTSGWLFEIAIWIVWRNENVGPTLLKIGLAFSLLLIAVPSVYWGVYLLLQILGVKL